MSLNANMKKDKNQPAEIDGDIAYCSKVQGVDNSIDIELEKSLNIDMS